MAKGATYKAEWSSDRAEAAFRDKEAVLWERTARPPEAIDVATQLGSTRVYRWSGAGTPVVFLHGMSDTSIRWIPFAEALYGHDVYSIDIIGDVGHSKPAIGLTSADDYAVWLGETLDSLDLTQPHIVGHSLGGYIAFRYAMTPNNVRSLIGFDPVGVVELKLSRLMSWSIRVGIASFTPAPVRRRLAQPLRQPLLNDKAAMAVLLGAQRGHPIRLPPLPVFTDDQLQCITVPIRVLVGAESTMFDTKRLADRINQGTPQGEAHILPEAGHALSVSHFNDCLAVVTEALAADDGV